MAPRRPQTPPQHSRRWSDLPSELLEKIGSCFQNNYVDVLRFRAVCSSWRRYSSTPLPPRIRSLSTLPPLVSRDNSYQYVLKELVVYSAQPARLSTTTPPLLLKQSLQQSGDDAVMILKLLNSPVPLDGGNFKYRGKVFDLQDFRVNEMGFDHHLVPSGHGCSAVVNPREVAVSSRLCNIGDDKGFTVMAVLPRYFASLAVWRMGEESWTIITQDPRSFHFDSVSYLNDKFYAMDLRRNIAVIEYDKEIVTLRQVAQGKGKEHDRYKEPKILVESLGNIFLVQGDLEQWKQDRTFRFEVEKLDEKEGRWVKPSRDELKGHLLFAGYCRSFSLMPNDFPEYNKTNCIHFTDFCIHSPFAIFDLEDGRVKSWCEYHGCKWQLPTWRLPKMLRRCRRKRKKSHCWVRRVLGFLWRLTEAILEFFWSLTEAILDFLISICIEAADD
ncbi:hypothetical protein Tsubulata_030175 [Turnera subulata]|uniref:KIB1-4 beta-propeller domain-containing protein n=1 Tax=Turnera subulata TaxID=218843 RepID=A0A9Q0FAM0_9ROSI|nr:hypothetical protein Tsubulata_030175 [Turnera subulata]